MGPATIAMLPIMVVFGVIWVIVHKGMDNGKEPIATVILSGFLSILLFGILVLFALLCGVVYFNSWTY